MSTGCIKDVDNAHDKPPANADFRTLPAGISTGGGTATTVAASNQILLHNSFKLKSMLRCSCKTKIYRSHLLYRNQRPIIKKVTEIVST